MTCSAMSQTVKLMYKFRQQCCDLLVTKMQAPTPDEKKTIATTFLNEETAKDEKKYKTYITYYEKCFWTPPGGYSIPTQTPAYQTHDAVVLSFKTLIANVQQNKKHFCKIFPEGISLETSAHALRALLDVSLMIHNHEDDSDEHTVGDFVSRKWEDDQCFAAFVQSCFPSPQSCKEARTALEQRRRLTAWNLAIRYKVKLQPTDNLAKHLIFDENERTLYVFRHVRFLKAHLERSTDESADTGFEESLKK